MDSRHFNPDDYQDEVRWKRLDDKKTEKLYFDYPTEPIGGSNPNYKCASCGMSVPEINGRLEGHLDFCEWRIMMENPKVSELQYTDAVQLYFTKYVVKNPQIRLGQFLCNLFLITDSVVFYQEDQEKVMELFTERHVGK